MKPARAAWLAVAVLALASNASAATLAADAVTLGATADLTARLPIAHTFTVATAAQVKVTLADLAAPQAFSQLKLVVSRDGAKVLSLDAAGNQQFATTPGTYKVQVVGVPAAATGTAASAGTFDVEVRELNGNTVLQHFTDGAAALPPAPGAQSGLDTTVAITQAGTYQVTLSDRGFPAALANVSVLASPASAGGTMATISGPCITACVQSFTVSAPGNYDLFVVATAADPDQAGLYSLKITGGPAGATVYASTQAVGLLPAATSIALPAAGGYTLSSSDFATPSALSTLKLRLVQGADLLASLDTAGSSIATASAAAGSSQLYVFSRAATGGIGVYGIALTQGVQAVYGDVRTLPSGFDTTLNAGGYRYPFAVTSAANYRLQVRDLNFPNAFTQVRGVVVQNGAVVQSVTGSAIDSSFQLAAGPAYLALIGSTPANANSMMGISLAPSAGGAAILDQAQGVGALFSAQTVTIPSAGSYDLAVNDLRFPAAFGDLSVAVTRGSELVGRIFGGGTLRFNAQAGVHTINLLARADTTARYGTFGYALAPTAPAPTVTLSASPTSVDRNQKTTLTWSASDASICSASGDWSGARALSGTEASVALASAATFTLSCTGDGGSTTRSIDVGINAASKGGGAMDVSVLLLLAGLLYARQRRLRA